MANAIDNINVWGGIILLVNSRKVRILLEDDILIPLIKTKKEVRRDIGTETMDKVLNITYVRRVLGCDDTQTPV